MIIGVDATCWWNSRGFGRFTRELLNAMFRLERGHSFHVFSDQEIPELAGFEHVASTLVATSRPTIEAAVANGSRSPLDMLRMTRAVAGTQIDCMFFPAVYSWYPVPPRLPTMLTVMDAIAEHYPQLIFPEWRSRLFWYLKMRGALWNCDRVLTLTEAAKQEIATYIGVDTARIDVCSCAPNPSFSPVSDPEKLADIRQRMRLPLNASLIVYVGGMAPHKNLLGLLEGFESAQASGRLHDTHLVLVGDFSGAGFHSNHGSLVQRVAASRVMKACVHFTGHLSDADLVLLYSTAVAAAMPSYSEGFGLPAIEAMACGTPVLASSEGSLPEVVGEAGVYFDPFDTRAIADAIIEMVNNKDKREALGLKSVARARDFTWERAAGLALDHLENMYRD